VKRLGRVAGVVFVVALLMGGATIWPVAFRTPSVDPRPLPSGLIAAESSAGQQLLAGSKFVADYASLTKAFESQSRAAFCGVASSVVVLNALRDGSPRLTQAAFFDDAANHVRSQFRVTLQGMSLAQLADLLRAHDVNATLFYTSDTDLDAFRTIAQKNLQARGDFILVNYERAALGQGETGHISPLAAYNGQADRLLILDVAAYKYPPVWVATQALWNAMNTVDSASGRNRGFVVVGKALPHT
jgi:hypothetical protein